MTNEEIKSWKETLTKAGWKEQDTDLGLLWKHPELVVKYTFESAIDEHKSGNKTLEYCRKW